MTKVHRNLHKACWSIRRKGDKTAHQEAVCLANVVFRVSEAGRAKVLEKRVRSVHAYAQGEEIPCSVYGLKRERVRYNPYRAGAFLTEDGREVWAAQYAFFHADGSCEVIL